MIIPDEFVETAKWALGAIAAALGWKGALRLRADKRADHVQSQDQRARDQTIDQLTEENARLGRNVVELDRLLAECRAQRWEARERVYILERDNERLRADNGR